MSGESESPQAKGGIILFQSNDGQTKIQVRFEDKSVWLTQAAIAELFQTTPQNITLHLKSIFEEGELAEAATCKQYLQVRQEGKRQISRQLRHYSLEAILAVGYRVRSSRGTQFRQWATAQLQELLVKGFVMDDERLKEGKSIVQDYFDELLLRIRDIRASERRFYQKITDIYATSIDYDGSAQVTQEFYAMVQNKLHWATHGKTAAEVIKSRADASKKNMGLTTWKNSPAGAIRKQDVSVAKNYLSEEELAALNRTVVMYLDYAEDQALKGKPMHMSDWIKKLDGFLQFNEKNILTNSGKISQKMALEHAESEFNKYEGQLRQVESSQSSSDFDELAKKLTSKKPKKKGKS
ncbi:MAG: virulence RhuM family protein [Bdellovibrionales bacterium]|jgi:hypothetical protein|nr:virulence RhuM family protein [Bdellovibrionales bacterium]